jgi:hypothetical protein
MTNNQPVGVAGRPHLPLQAEPVDRGQLTGAASDADGVQADLFNLPLGDLLGSVGQVLWPIAKDYLNA